MQISKKFDTVTLEKMGVSALLLVAGALITYLSDNLLKLVGAVGIPPEYQPVVLAVSTWTLNSIKEYWKGEVQSAGLDVPLEPVQ
jgi:hypothetical protein